MELRKRLKADKDQDDMCLKLRRAACIGSQRLLRRQYHCYSPHYVSIGVSMTARHAVACTYLQGVNT